MLYHGGAIGKLRVIKANSKSHTSGKMLAYFTEDRCYALICCRNMNENTLLRTKGPPHLTRQLRQHSKNPVYRMSAVSVNRCQDRAGEEF